MEKISCNITRDLLPLYVEGILSKESTEAVAAHLETCDACRRIYEQMTENLAWPVAPKIEAENKKTLKAMKVRLKRRRIVAICFSVVVTVGVMVAACAAYSNVDAVHDFVSENTIVDLRDVNTAGEWMPLTFENEKYLNYDRLICEKEVIVDANSSGGITFRICDTEGNIVVSPFYVAPGTSYSLEMLSRNTDYIVEIQTVGASFLIRFV